jgi:hypothetical protein
MSSRRRSTSGTLRRSKSSNASRSKAKNVAGSSTAAWPISSEFESRPRRCSRAKLGFPCASITTTSPSRMHASCGSALIARAISGKTAV